MRRLRGCQICFIAAAILQTSGALAALPWETWKSPYSIAELDPTDQVLERSSYCLDGCRYDHADLGWEGLANNPYPYRWLYTDGAEEVVFEDDGPGAITRLWMTEGNCIDPLTGIRIYIDGAATPALDIPLYTLFDGSRPPFTPPLTLARDQSSGGYVSYVPIAYAQRIRITLTNADNGFNSCTGNDYRALWFQFQYHRLPLGTLVTSFDGSTDAPALRALLAHAGDDPWAGGLMPSIAAGSLAPSSALPLDAQAGSGWLRGLRLHLPRNAYAHVNLRLNFDDIVSVDMPLADFFAVGAGAAAAAQGVLVGEGNDGWLYVWFPMPYHHGASAALYADAALTGEMGVQATLYWDNAAVSENAGTFTAQLHDTCPTMPGHDFMLYAASGAGRVVGISAAYKAYGTPTMVYLEGDERAYRDGATAPVWYGTGVEDFYNGGFYFVLGPYSRPLSGATALDPDGTGVTTVYRLLLTDFLNYESKLDWRQEAGPTGQVPMCARSVTYAYAVPTATMVPYAQLDLGDPASVQQHAYQPSPASSCSTLDASYGDEPPTTQSAQVCSYTSGSSSFTFAVQAAAVPLRLRRTFDAAQPGQAAEVWVNGALAGRFPYTAGNPARRWQQQDVVLNTPVIGTTFQFEIRPRFANPDGATVFTESVYELWGGTTDEIFLNDFDVPVESSIGLAK